MRANASVYDPGRKRGLDQQQLGFDWRCGVRGDAYTIIAIRGGMGSPWDFHDHHFGFNPWCLEPVGPVKDGSDD